MRAVPVTPRQVMFTVCGQCPSLHAEGLNLHVHVTVSDIVMTLILSLTGTWYVKLMYGIANNTKL